MATAGQKHFDRMCDPQGLTEAWQRVKGNRGGPGGDGEDLETFGRDAGRRIERLAIEMRMGLYRPGPLRRFAIPKPSGGERTLAVPCIVDRVAQTAAAMILEPVLEQEFEDASFAYRPGRSVKQAVERVAYLRSQGFRWVVDGDIRAYFDNVPHAQLLERLRGIVNDDRVVELVGLWLDGFGDGGRGLAQGSPISPLLSNLYLDSVDEAIERHGVHLVRFADDFVLLTRTQDKAHAALERMAQLLAQHGLELHPEKTRIVSFEDAFRFLGHIFVRALVVSSPEGSRRPPGTSLVPTAAAQEAGRPSPADRAIPRLIRGRPEAVEPDRMIEQGEDGEDLAATLAPLYVLSPGCVLGVSGEGFRVLEDGNEILTVPARNVGRIDLGAAVEARDEALRLALDYRVPVAFLDGYGYVRGTLIADAAGDPTLHRAQARIALDEVRRLAMARTLVGGKLRNGHALLKRLNRRRKEASVENACEVLLDARRRADVARTLDEARGFEGQGAAAYWPALGQCLERGWTLTRRRRAPAPDPVNALLDWTASMLARDVRAAVLRVGLHPGFGTLHAEAESRDACVFDLIEEFRAPLAESLVVYLFNNRILAAEDFVPQAEPRTVRIQGGAGAHVVRMYEAWLARAIRDPASGRRITWRGMILGQARAFARAAREDLTYRPYAMDY